VLGTSKSSGDTFLPRLLVEGSNAPEPAHAEASMQPSASPNQANGPSDGGDYGPVADSVAEHGQDDDVAQPPRKRRGMRTSSPTTCRTTPEPQTSLHRAGQARRRTVVQTVVVFESSGYEKGYRAMDSAFSIFLSNSSKRLSS
jgi:hypothetical protein